jgi:hypothetical protein
MIKQNKNYEVQLTCRYCHKFKIIYLNFHPEQGLIKYTVFVCSFCGLSQKISPDKKEGHTQYTLRNLKNENKMKIEEIPDEEIKIRNSLPENINFTLEDVKNADYNNIALENKEGEKYKQWIMTFKNKDEYKIPVCVMNAFKKMTEKGLKEIEIDKTGSGLNTKYMVSYTK